ncbi:hypothetical protein [Paracidovorax wautersii]|uniref:hypothetical protein n=1 Tax=Paracidovorax wautersii TaxID=1177982 RepID=UPI0031D402E2
MLHRALFVFLLLLLPLQWAAAQMHESRPSSSEATAQAPVAAQDHHAPEHGGTPCLFHTLAQPAAHGGAPQAPGVPGHMRRAWDVPLDLDHHGTGAASDIDRPRWRACGAPATVDCTVRA